jgi:hypothetical protein
VLVGIDNINSREGLTDLYTTVYSLPMKKTPASPKTRIQTQFHCEVCGADWWSMMCKPTRCGKCKTPYWDRKKTSPKDALQTAVSNNL